ncbi:hypothetical protein HK096_003651 [Nowakowskiella sp. JEL0078]|nr:hypothetical protein HK096_003651 [Nowakowskiella sp. JEL0078]
MALALSAPAASASANSPSSLSYFLVFIQNSKNSFDIDINTIASNEHPAPPASSNTIVSVHSLSHALPLHCRKTAFALSQLNNFWSSNSLFAFVKFCNALHFIPCSSSNSSEDHPRHAPSDSSEDHPRHTPSDFVLDLSRPINTIINNLAEHLSSDLALLLLFVENVRDWEAYRCFVIRNNINLKLFYSQPSASIQFFQPSSSQQLPLSLIDQDLVASPTVESPSSSITLHSEADSVSTLLLKLDEREKIHLELQNQWHANRANMESVLLKTTSQLNLITELLRETLNEQHASKQAASINSLEQEKQEKKKKQKKSAKTTRHFGQDSETEGDSWDDNEVEWEISQKLQKKRHGNRDKVSSLETADILNEIRNCQAENIVIPLFSGRRKRSTEPQPPPKLKMGVPTLEVIAEVDENLIDTIDTQQHLAASGETTTLLASGRRRRPQPQDDVQDIMTSPVDSAIDLQSSILKPSSPISISIQTSPQLSQCLADSASQTSPTSHATSIPISIQSRRHPNSESGVERQRSLSSRNPEITVAALKSWRRKLDQTEIAPRISDSSRRPLSLASPDRSLLASGGFDDIVLDNGSRDSLYTAERPVSLRRAASVRRLFKRHTIDVAGAGVQPSTSFLKRLDSLKKARRVSVPVEALVRSKSERLRREERSAIFDRKSLDGEERIVGVVAGGLPGIGQKRAGLGALFSLLGGKDEILFQKKRR